MVELVVVMAVLSEASSWSYSDDKTMTSASSLWLLGVAMVGVVRLDSLASFLLRAV